MLQTLGASLSHVLTLGSPLQHVKMYFSLTPPRADRKVKGESVGVFFPSTGHEPQPFIRKYLLLPLFPGALPSTPGPLYIDVFPA